MTAPLTDYLRTIGSVAPRYPLTREGKSLLAKAARQKGMGATALAKHCGCKHSLINQLLSTGGVGATKPIWSSHVVPKLCEVLEVPLWAVVEGMSREHRLVLSAMAVVRKAAPKRYEAFVADVLSRARDIAEAHGWVFRDDDDDGATPLEGPRRLPR